MEKGPLLRDGPKSGINTDLKGVFCVFFFFGGVESPRDTEQGGGREPRRRRAQRVRWAAGATWQLLGLLSSWGGDPIPPLGTARRE